MVERLKFGFTIFRSYAQDYLGLDFNINSFCGYLSPINTQKLDVYHSAVNE